MRLLKLIMLLLIWCCCCWLCCCCGPTCCYWSHYILFWSMNVVLRLLKATVEFLWWGGWWGLQSHFHVQPNFCVGVVLYCVVVGVATTTNLNELGPNCLLKWFTVKKEQMHYYGPNWGGHVIILFLRVIQSSKLVKI